jgi:hypothetical protein
MSNMTLNRRVVACLAACNGISSEALESGAIERLHKSASVALRKLQELHPRIEHADIGACIVRLQVALNKLEDAI